MKTTLQTTETIYKYLNYRVQRKVLERDILSLIELSSQSEFAIRSVGVFCYEQVLLFHLPKVFQTQQAVCREVQVQREQMRLGEAKSDLA